MALPLVIKPEDLQPLIADPNLLLLDLSHPENYQQGHLPGSIHVNPGETQYGLPPAPGLLPPLERLEQLVDRIGLRTDHTLVVYDDEGGGWAGRMIWLLDSIGFSGASLLSGGAMAWQAMGYDLTAEPGTPGKADFKIAMNPRINVTLDELKDLLEDQEVVVWDARSPLEYQGLRQTAAKNGHMPGAVNYEWTRAMNPEHYLALRNLDKIKEELAMSGIDGSLPVITHCQTHHRSGLTYLLGKALGYKIRAYPGSWSEWGNHPETPVVT